MSSESHVRNLFSYYSEATDVSIVEGVMGMFDGFNKMKGSSADIARILDIPVILLINAASTAYSVAATIYGFTHFCPDVKVAGVIFNRVASENHFSFLRKACEDVGVECFGYLKKNTALQTPSRHLGLTLSSREDMNSFIEMAADEVVKNVDVNRILEATSRLEYPKEELKIPVLQNLIVAVARDEAFNFIYPTNLNTFRKIIYFSPLHDQRLPEADLVYLPGGYPELFAEELSKNIKLRNEIKTFAESGGRILAECGGLIYLCEEIDGEKMCGVFPLKATMKDSKLSLGYRTIEFPRVTLKGHEFHYSHIIDPLQEPSIALQKSVKDMSVETPVYRYKNTIAGYTHLYWAETDLLKLWE